MFRVTLPTPAFGWAGHPAQRYPPTVRGPIASCRGGAAWRDTDATKLERTSTDGRWQVMAMAFFGKRQAKSARSTVRCGNCGGTTLGLGYVDRVACSVLHTCESCGYRWRDRLVDVADRELAARR